MSGVVYAIGAHALTCAAAVIIADRVASWRHLARHRRRQRASADHLAHVKAAEREPAAVRREIRRQVELGRASFLDPSFQPKRQDDPDLNEAFDRLFEINQELLLFDAMITAPRDEIDVDRVADLWADFSLRRQAARDRLRARRRELERCRT